MVESIFTTTSSTITYTLNPTGILSPSSLPNEVTSTNLTSVVLGTSVKSIAANTFKDFTLLQSVTIANTVTNIGNSAFENTGLLSVTIPDSVTAIGESAFEGSSAMTSVTLGTGIRTFGDKAFKDCTSLGDFYPKDSSSLTLEAIGDNVFENTVLENFNVPNSVTTININALAGSIINQLYATYILLDRFNKTTGVQTIFGKSNVNVIVIGVGRYTPPIICFPRDTPVTTDQGNIPIQDLENKPYTIEGNKVLGIVSMTSNEAMVYFKQHSLAYNVPNKNTYITQSHVIYHNNTQLKAIDYTKKDFHKRLCSNNLKGIKQEKPILVKLENTKVYNVVLESGHKMKVNNMLVETLHPSNELYKQKVLK